MKKLILGVLVLLTLIVFTATGFGDEQLKVVCPREPVRGYEGCEILVEVPEDGMLTLSVTDGLNLWRTLRAEVKTGSNRIFWDGLGENRQELKNGTYTVSFVFNGDNQKDCEAAGKIQIRGKLHALRYALPSSDVLYLENGPKWMVEYSMAGSGTFVMDVLKGGEVIHTITRKPAYDDCYYQIWDGTLKKDRKIEPGEYVLSCYSMAEPENRFESVLRVEEKFTAAVEVGVTGPVMAEREMNDDEIWALMMKPSVVSMEGKLGHQKVYSAPSKDGKVLGTLHGQTQGMEVIRVTDTGWALVRAWEHEDGATVTGYVPMNRLTIAYPNDRYGILVDKKTQTATIFEEGKRIGTIRVSTGMVAKGKMIRETQAGSFLTEVHECHFQSDGKTYDYPLRYDGGNLLHQAGYRIYNNRKDFTAELPLLGTKASHGCVRLDPFVTEDSPINAYWLWTHMPYHTRIMILDDPEERIAEAEKYAGVRVEDKFSYDTLMTVYEGPQPAQEIGEKDTTIVLTVGGDAVLGTREEWRRDEDAFPAYITRNGFSYPFKNLQEWFAADDMTFINLECVLQNTGEGEKYGKMYHFRGNTNYTKILQESSVEQVNLANNHFVDYQDMGKVSTKEALREAGIGFSGYSQLYVMEKDGHKIGFGGIRETIYVQNPKRVREEIKKLREKGCDVVIYSCHWGVEYDPNHNEIQTEMAKTCTEAGADIVIGTHPHVVQGVGNVDDTVVLWSLGNLTFGGTKEMTTFDATLARLELIFDEYGYKGVNVTMIPILTSSRAAEGINDYCPVPAEGEDRERIMNLIRADSAYDIDGTMFFAHERAERKP